MYKVEKSSVENTVQCTVAYNHNVSGRDPLTSVVKQQWNLKKQAKDEQGKMCKVKSLYTCMYTTWNQFTKLWRHDAVLTLMMYHQHNYTNIMW